MKTVSYIRGNYTKKECLVIFSLLLLTCSVVNAQGVSGVSTKTESISSYAIILAIVLLINVVALIFSIVRIYKLKHNLHHQNNVFNEQIEHHTGNHKVLQEDKEKLEKQFKSLKTENEQLQDKIVKYQELLEVKDAGDFLPICSNCKDIRDPEGFWHSIEEYIQNLSDSDFSHSLCPDCTKKLYPDLFEGGAKPFCLTWKSGFNRKQGPK